MEAQTQYSPKPILAAVLVAASLGSPLLADQLPNPAVTTAANAYGQTSPFLGAYSVNNLFDTSTGTEYASERKGYCTSPLNNNGTYVELDFGSAVTFDRFILMTRNNTADSVISNRLYIGNSPTHSLSDIIVSFTTAGNNGQGIIQKFSPVTGRYVRWEVLTASASTANLGGNMMQFLATPAGMIQLSTPTVINSSTPFNSTTLAAAHAVDGYAGLNNNEGAFASLGAGANMFIDFDLGVPTVIAGWDFLNRSGDVVTAYNMIFANVSDFSSGATTNSYTANASGLVLNTVALGSPITARYVRLQATASTGGNNTGVREIQFYGSATAPPVMVQNPFGGTYGQGDYCKMTASATGAGISYQWYTNNTRSPLSGFTSSTVVFNNVDFANAGDYTVVANNSYGAVTSSVANLVVLPHGAVITPVAATASSFYSANQDPVNLINGSGLWGSGNVLYMSHSNNGSAGGMWHTTGGAVNTNWVIFDLGAPGNLTGLDIWQMNQNGNLGRGVKTFGVFTSPNDTDPPTAYVGTFTLRIAGGTLDERLQYLPFTANNVRRVMIALTNDWNGLANDYAGLSEVRFEGSMSPTIAQAPQSATNYVWGVQSFSVTVAGTAPLSYQWYRDGSPATPIPDATNAAFTINPVTTSSAGSFFVIATNSLGSVTSAVATLTVLDPTPDYTSALVAYYSFDETSGTTAADSSGNGTSATLSNFPTDDSMWVSGRVGRGLEFNASDTSTDDQVITDTALNLSNDTSFTFAFWAKRISDNNPYNPRIIGPVSAVDGQYWVVWKPGTGVGFYPPAPSPEPIRDVWQHFVITYDRLLGKYETYVDGHLQASATSTNYIKDSPAGMQWAIGCKEILTDFRDPWRGYLDDVRVYNRILTPPDVLALYQVAGSVAPSFSIQPQSDSLFVGETLRLRTAVDGTPPITYQWYKNGTSLLTVETNLTLVLTNVQISDSGDYTMVAANALKATTSTVAHVVVTAVTSITNGLGGYWKLDETTGAAAADASGNGGAGTVLNMPLDGGQWAAGQVGGALRFRGLGLGDDLVTVPNWPKAQNGTMTLSAWVLPEVNTSLACIAAGGAGFDGIGQFTLNQRSGGGLSASLQTAAHTTVTVTYPSSLQTNAWQHVVLVADGSRLILYQNGIPVGSANYDSTLYPVTNVFTIGARAIADDTSADSFWQGKIDDAAYWTRALSPGEVFKVFAAGAAGSSVATADAYTNPPPVITMQPQGGAVYLHDPLALEVAVTAISNPLTYQWWKDGVPLAGAIYGAYFKAVVDFTDGGSYRVVATAANGMSVTSAPAVITISAPMPDIASGLVLHLKLDETSGTVAADSTTNANHGALLNFPNAHTNWAPGMIDGALLFADDGVNINAVAVPGQPYLDFGANPFSLSLWAKGPPVQTANAGLLCKGVSPAESYWIDVYAGAYRFGVRNSTGQIQTSAEIGSGTAPDGQWQHIAVIYDPSQGQSRMYIDGALVGIGVTVDSVYSSGTTVDIGGRQSVNGYSYGFTGMLDDVRIYGRAITPVEVRALAYQGYPPAIALHRAGPQVTLSWPLEASGGYQLESATSLVGSGWTTVPGVTTNSFSFTPGGGNVFYRLHRK